MRKNLFLTLALLLATFAGATAQDWSVTLDATLGLPGDTVLNEKNEKYIRFQSGIINTDAPIKKLRFTVAGTASGAKPNGNNFIFALSELNVYNADDMTKELNYTARSNADYMTLTQSFNDGIGLKALNDGKYDNYFHSMYSANGAVAEYHYIEMIFEEPISRFVIEWGSRNGNMKDAPTVVGLTAGGVDFVPYTDRIVSFGEEKITDFGALANGAYFTIRGNAVSVYNEYYNNDEEGKLGDLKEENKEGTGPMYTKPGDANGVAKPTAAHIAKLIPTGDDDDTYYIYFPLENAYLSGDAYQNALNSALNGWQHNTKDIEKAAKVGFDKLANGDFEMFYNTEIEVEDNPETEDKNEAYDYKDRVYIAADPRTSKMKIFAPNKKDALEIQKWCEGFAFECAFNWSLYPAEYQAPSWAKEYDLSLVYINTKKLVEAIEDYSLLEDFVESFEEVVASLGEALSNIDNLTEEAIKTLIDENKPVLSELLYCIAEAEEGYMIIPTNANSWAYFKAKIGDNVGQYSQAAYNKYMLSGEEFIRGFVQYLNDHEEEYYTCYDKYIAGVVNYFANRTANLEALLASVNKTSSNALPLTFEVEPTQTPEAKIELGKAINGFRWTLIENQNKTANNAGDLYTSITEMEITANGEKVTLTADNLSSNATHEGDGHGLAGLVDGDADTFWHAMYDGQTHNPAGPAYIDVKFPEGTSLDNFTIKFTNRGGQAHTWQTKFVIGEYGKSYDDDGVDRYKVALGDKITDLTQLEDGGLYILQGNLKVNVTEDAKKPRYYKGTAPYTENAKDAANVACVYMFKKNGDAWNILGLSTAKYLKGLSLATLLQSEADDVKIVASQNMENTWVMYNDIDTVLTSDYTYQIDENTSIAFGNKEVKAKYQVYMDWDGGMASRPCYSPLPGVADPQFTDLTDEMKLTSSCGDYLHFNKTNGEGEWTIYKATMNNEYYAYLLALAKEVEELNIITGINPGCVIADEEVANNFDEAKAAATVAVENKDTENAKAVSKALIEAVEALGKLERVGIDPEAVYRIESSLKAFEEKTGYTRSVYAGDNKLAWKVTPGSFDGENYDFLFRISNDEDEMYINSVDVPEAEKGKAYIMQNIGNGKWIGKNWTCAKIPSAYVIEHIVNCEYHIKHSGTNDQWHAENHYSGGGYGGNLISHNSNGGNNASAWTFIYMGEFDDYELSVEDVVVKGDEVVSVSYFTPAGVAIAEPVKGLNIIVTVYANGVIEAKKVLVK